MDIKSESGKLDGKVRPGPLMFGVLLGSYWQDGSGPKSELLQIGLTLSTIILTVEW